MNASSRIKISPLAKRLATEKGLDWQTLSGTGPGGRIVKADIEKAGQGGFVGQVVTMPLSEPKEPFRDVPLNKMRQIIAGRLTEAKQTIPHFYLTIDMLADKLIDLREQLLAIQPEPKISINDLMIKAAALALRDVPEANASWMGDKIRYYNTIDISVAVAVEGGLVTPIIRQADRKSLIQIATEMRQLAETARAGKLAPEQYQGGGFSLSNLGMYGIKDFAAIINPPQSCILAIGTTEKKPVVVDNQITIGSVMSCSLSADHRVVDGVIGARYLAALKKIVEQPLRLMYS